MKLKLKALTKSIWVFHFACSPCNNCDIEILDLLTPRYDVERFGIQLIGSIRHADVLLVTGIPNNKTARKLREVYAQAPQPCLVVAIGSCALGGCTFRGSYNVVGRVDNIIPVHAYVAGCPPKPEAMIMGIVKLLNSLKNNK
jgi:membrane-bound hydrogenase subunit mbhJ